jgi:hypothetical protein
MAALAESGISVPQEMLGPFYRVFRIIILDRLAIFVPFLKAIKKMIDLLLLLL